MPSGVKSTSFFFNFYYGVCDNLRVFFLAGIDFGMEFVVVVVEFGVWIERVDCGRFVGLSQRVVDSVSCHWYKDVAFHGFFFMFVIFFSLKFSVSLSN